MSNLYRLSKDVPTTVICARLRELAAVAAAGNLAKDPDTLSLNVPAQPDRDIDLILMEAASRLQEFNDEQMRRIEELRAMKIETLNMAIEGILIGRGDRDLVADIDDTSRLLTRLSRAHRFDLVSPLHFNRELSVMPPEEVKQVRWTRYTEERCKKLKELCDKIAIVEAGREDYTNFEYADNL